MKAAHIGGANKSQIRPEDIYPKLIKLTAGIVLATAFTLTACGGDGAKKSGLPSNELLGKLPAIHADYKLSLNAN